jgi:hypothetical protein
MVEKKPTDESSELEGQFFELLKNTIKIVKG